MALFWLSDEAWAAIEPHLPQNQPGARRVDDRRVISGILHVLKIGCRWCDCPADYGPATTIYNRFNRWSRWGFWVKLLDALAEAGAVPKSAAIDSTYIKAQRPRATPLASAPATRSACHRPCNLPLHRLSDGRRVVVLGRQQTVTLSGEPAPRGAKSSSMSSPFPPAAETWARTVVLSMLEWPSAMISASVTESASQTPASLQRRNRR